MNNNLKNKKFDEYISSILFSLSGKISKNDFNQIKKHYNWKFNYKKIHVVGTNGKGSCAKYINDELIEQEYKVGMFTSPHINVLYERIKINNIEIDFESCFKFITDLKTKFIDVNFGFFDVLFLLAIKCFEDNNVDVAIFEAGIGAKKDVVNYIDHDITLITSIGIDHEEILGKTVEQIASDKAFAIKSKNNVYIQNNIDKHAIKIFKKRANIVKNTNLKLVEVNNKTYVEINESLSKFVLKQEFNISKFKSFFLLPQGRIEKIYVNNIECYLDVSHNEQGFIETIKYFKINNIYFDQVVVSLSNDKNMDKIFDLLEQEFKTIFVFENNGRKPQKISNYPPKFIRIYNLNNWLKKLNSKTLFIGSFYFVSQINKELNDYSKNKL